ncbi:MAG TPA: hypothetical protein VFZ59_04260 [Verrucomicrobiae bacterium]|nr:hypothetical protein [Verrucomicrobiae bacterium]
MSSELSIFAARLRAFMELSLEDHGPLDAESASALAQHADAEFNGMAMVLFALQFGRNQPYRKLCESRGVSPNAVAHWSVIPAVPTSAFKEFEMTCLLPDQRKHVFHSSGTTEQRPSRHFHSAESLEVYEASLWAGLQGSLRFAIYDLRLLSLTPPPAQVPRSSLVHMFGVVQQKLGAGERAFVGGVDANGAWVLDSEAALAALSAKDVRPLLILGTAFSFVHLLDELASRNVRVQLPADSRVMETGGYKGRSREMSKAELHALITERLGVPAQNIICEYGMSELSSQAYEVTGDEWHVTGIGSGKSRHTSRATRHFRFPPWARVQVISPETGREVADGETGLIRVFDLANVFSVMAIQTEDLAIRRGEGFELIGRAKLAEPRGCSLMSGLNTAA